MPPVRPPFRLGRALGALHDLDANMALSPSRLRAQSLARAERLRRAGVVRGDRAVLPGASRWEFFIDLFGLWALGACAVVVDPDASDSELARAAAAAGATAIIGGARVRRLRAARAGASGAGAGAAAPDDWALVLWTSGTAAGPKAVVHTFRTLQSRLSELRRRIPTRDSRRTLCVLPVHFGHGLIGNSLFPLLHGGDLALSSRAGAGVGLAELGAVIDRQRITFVSGVPALWRAAIRLSAPPRRRSLRRAHCASAPMDGRLGEELRSWAGTASVWNVYGLTETASWISGARFGRRERSEGGCVGTGWGARFRLSTAGEVWVRAESLTPGYLRKGRIVRAADAAGWYRTGDVAHRDRSGALHLAGRLDHRINKGGLKVHAEQVEEALKRHPAVLDACAFSMPDAVLGETVGAAVVLARRGASAAADLRRWCRLRMPKDAVPEELFFVTAIARTSRGKIERRRVAAMCLGRR
ncbi:MAG: acyl--CoA ligase [Elusimicrobia bacterium]|nr:acyl--CoA ligase [Elusimicrobiota bacterium]